VQIRAIICDAASAVVDIIFVFGAFAKRESII